MLSNLVFQPNKNYTKSMTEKILDPEEQNPEWIQKFSKIRSFMPVPPRNNKI